MEQPKPQGREEVEVVATRLIELCQNNQFIQAQHELYDPLIERVEVDGRKISGLENTLAQEERFLNNLAAIQTRICQLTITKQYFSLLMSVNFTLKSGEVKSMEEIYVYKVAHGKIVFEQFFQ